MKSKFQLKTGLSAYSFACGYQQIAAIGDVTLTMWHEGACFHVRAHDHENAGRLFWESFDNVTQARKFFETKLIDLFGDKVKDIKRDKRYTVTFEFCGYVDPKWVVRFCGDWVDTSTTKSAAYCVAYTHAENRLPKGGSHENA